MTPDDHIAVVVDEGLPHLALLLRPVLDELVSVGIDPANITLICEPSASQQLWRADLPKEFEKVRLEIHEPQDRKN